MTRSTGARRPGRSPGSGTPSRMPASRIFRFARTIRCATAGSGSNNSRAIDAVGSPHTTRKVSITRDAGSSAGWQHANSSASWSSPATALRSGSAAAHPRAAWCSFRARALSRRRWSSARRRATATTQPPGLAGRPSRGHCSTAAAHASCAQSSASDRSPESRATAAAAGHHAERSARSMSPVSAAPSPSPAGPRPTRT